MSEVDEYAKFRESSVPDNFTNVLRQHVDNQEIIQAKIEALSKELEHEKDLLKGIQEQHIPAALGGLHGKFDLKDGRWLEVDQKIRASIAGDKKEPAVKWMDDNDYGHIVKRVVTIQFSKDDNDLRLAFYKMVREFETENFVKLVIEEDQSIHWMTLESWVREQLKEGVAIPKDIFGIYTQYISKVTGEKKHV